METARAQSRLAGRKLALASACPRGHARRSSAVILTSGCGCGSCTALPLRARPQALLLPLLVVLAGLLAGARASPPVDYFIYTSQLASAQAGTQNVTSILQPVASVYAPAPAASSSALPAANASQQLDSQQQEQQQRRRRKHLDELAERVLALVRNQSHTHDNEQVDLEAARYAWALMERQADAYMRNRVHALRPFVVELLAEAQVSGACARSVSHWLEALAELRQSATLMWNSWGQFPAAGLFQGSYTDLGSYSGCMSIGDSEPLGAPQYCMLDFQPLVPSRPRFHSIFKQVLGHDAASGQLTAGDFDAHRDARAGPRPPAHEFASSRFKQLAGLELGASGGGGQARPGALAGQQSPMSKYSKRTIDAAAPANGSQQQLAEGPAPADSSAGLNITLKAEALIELAKRAHYFYYVKFRIGACLPSHCSPDDVQKLASAAGQRAILQSSSVNCMKKEPFHLNTYQLVAICILAGLALIAVLGAIVDILGYKEDRQNSSALVNWLLPFSLWTNSKRLFDLQTAGTHGDLECVHGLRFFSMLWVIYGHTILYMEYQSFTHFYDVVESQIPSLMLLPSLNANFSVDTFFVISGILTTYVTWEYTKGDARKFNKFAFMISRYIRLTPQLAIVILCFFILPLFGDGPMYRAVADSQAQVCYENWLINLLYLQSYVRAEKHCIDPSWWLSIEMTFHVVSVLVIIVMINNPRRGMWVNFLVAASFTLAGALIHYTNGFAIQYLPSIPQRYEIRAEQTKLFFHRPYPHAASYFIGIALGYVLANKTVKKLKPARAAQGWCVCALGLALSLWGTYYWNLGAPYTQLQATLYYNLCQILWPLSIAWLILACSLGHGGPVNAILSARCFVPLGRITYMTYLSHSLIIYFHSARMNMTLEPSMLFFTYLFIANTVLALLLGVLLTVVYESPILNLQKQLFTYLTQKFDPTLRHESQCLPTRLPTSSSAAAAAAAAAALSPASQIGCPEHAEDRAPLAPGESRKEALVTSNGFKHGNGLLGGSAAAQCLLLDKNNDKQVQQQKQPPHA